MAPGADAHGSGFAHYELIDHCSPTRGHLYPALPMRSCFASLTVQPSSESAPVSQDDYLENLTRLFGAVGHEGTFWSDPNPSRGPVTTLIVRDDHLRHEDTKWLLADTLAFVRDLMEDGGFPRTDFPPDVLAAAAVLFYLDQVQVGSHAEFLLTAFDVVLIDDIDKAIARIGLDKSIGPVWQALMRCLQFNPGLFKDPKAGHHPILKDLDRQLSVAERAAQTRIAAFIRALPDICVCHTYADYRAAMDALLDH
jgi:hypothetical protein